MTQNGWQPQRRSAGPAGAGAARRGLRRGPDDHYCLTYDGSDWTLYFDGSQADTGTVAANTGTFNTLRLGHWYSVNYAIGYFSGSIDEVYVYSSALDAAAVQVLYDAVTAPPSLAPTMTPLPTHVSLSTLVAYYSFDDGTAAEASDSSLDGTIEGATATTGRDGSGALSLRQLVHHDRRRRGRHPRFPGKYGPIDCDHAGE